ncbi:MAG: hypothetical protein QFX36_01950 [Archaeoglobales archaeon]|nr:hypothetical protein [Archaeoglobales archaeon]
MSKNIEAEYNEILEKALKMPGISDLEELHETIKKLPKDLRILPSSGYAISSDCSIIK